MGDSKLYSAQDIEKLKQKIATYKDTLTTLKTGNSVDDYLAMKSEANGFKTKVSKLEGVIEVMNEKQSMQLEEYEQQIKNFSVQMDSLNQTIEALNQDLSSVKNKFKKDDSNDFKEVLIVPVDIQSSTNITNNNEEREEEYIEETTSIPSMRKSNLPPSYKQLQSMIGKATNIQEVPSDVTPIVSIDIHKEYPEEQHLNKQSFPYTGIHPSQIYNGLFRNVNRPLTIHLTNAVKEQAIPINLNENSDPSLLLPTSEPEINETVIPYPEEVHNVTIIDEDKDLIEISNEMKRQQHKNKETLSLFNIFRKKQ
jgi:prefoldin subunit 5